MPTYSTTSSVPQGISLASWIAFVNRLKATPELAWLDNQVIRHDITALPANRSPLLCVVKVGQDIQQETIGRNRKYNVYFKFGLRLYLHDSGGTVEQVEARYDLLENLTDVLVEQLRSNDYVICNNPHWFNLILEPTLTTIIGKENERLFTTTRLQLVRRV